MKANLDANRTRSVRRGRGDMGALQQYMREIQGIPLLDAAAEVALGERIRAGDRAAVDELVRHNLRFVVTVARRYAHHGVPIEDLIDEGNIGLIQAAERFDVRRGYRFISYAVWWIRQGILRFLSDKSRVVRLPVGKLQQLAKLERAAERLPQALGHEPTLEEIAAGTGFAPDQIERLRGLPTRCLCIDRPGEGQDSEFEMDTLEDPRAGAFESLVEEELRDRSLEDCLAKLTGRDRDIVRRYYGLQGATPETLERIGATYGVTRERTRQLRDRAIDRLRVLPECGVLAES
jgi:RNA polymerase primary sigma factor